MARAQSRLPVIGFLSSSSLKRAGRLLGAFRAGLLESGFVEGKNVAIEFRWGEGRYDLLPRLADELVRSQVSVLVASGGEPSALAAKAATSTIPTVFHIGTDPIKAGLVASYSRPGGNITGATSFAAQLGMKRLGLLHELVPHAATVGFLINPTFAPSAEQVEDARSAGEILGIKVRLFSAASEQEVVTAFETLPREKILAMAVAADPFFDAIASKFAKLAAQFAVPVIYQLREYPIAGGLMSYGVDFADTYRQVGVYAGRILRGEKASELPVVQPTKFEF